MQILGFLAFGVGDFFTRIGFSLAGSKDYMPAFGLLFGLHVASGTDRLNPIANHLRFCGFGIF